MNPAYCGLDFSLAGWSLVMYHYMYISGLNLSGKYFRGRHVD